MKDFQELFIQGGEVVAFILDGNDDGNPGAGGIGRIQTKTPLVGGASAFYPFILTPSNEEE
jgi:hypothetical protein